MTNVQQKLFEVGIIPVVVIDDVKDALPLAKALYEGGIKAAEVTFRTEAAADAIKAMSDAYPDMLVGAGTVLTPAQADKAKANGAKLAVKKFVRFETGEGLEKKVDDFAAEVAAQAGL